MLKPAAFCLLLAACATGGAGAGAIRVDREAAAHAAPRLAMTAAADSERVFPAAKDPQLPSADRIARRIWTVLGDVASADVRLCVAADGRVQAVEVVRGSSLAEFDEAVLRDVAHWQFSGFPGSSRAAKLQSCEIATINYRPHT